MQCGGTKICVLIIERLFWKFSGEIDETAGTGTARTRCFASNGVSVYSSTNSAPPASRTESTCRQEGPNTRSITSR